jgi:hypothetical protein
MNRKYILFSLALFTVILFGCNKKLDTVAKITIYNSLDNKLVPECRVVLWGKASVGPGSQDQGDVVLYDTAYTNSVGEAVFYYNELYQKGMAGVAILQIEAKKANYNGSGIIKVAEEETNEAIVYIQP